MSVSSFFVRKKTIFLWKKIQETRFDFTISWSQNTLKFTIAQIISHYSDRSQKKTRMSKCIFIIIITIKKKKYIKFYLKKYLIYEQDKFTIVLQWFGIKSLRLRTKLSNEAGQWFNATILNNDILNCNGFYVRYSWFCACTCRYLYIFENCVAKWSHWSWYSRCVSTPIKIVEYILYRYQCNKLLMCVRQITTRIFLVCACFALEQLK